MSRELDAQLAKALGWTGIEERPSQTYGTRLWGRNESGMFTEVFPYSADLNYCRRAEEKIVEMGLTDQYLRALVNLLRTQHFAPQAVPAAVRHADPSPWDCKAVLTAPAEVRCRAMLQVIGKGE